MQDAYKLHPEMAHKGRTKAKLENERRTHGVELQTGSRLWVQDFKERAQYERNTIKSMITQHYSCIY